MMIRGVRLTCFKTAKIFIAALCLWIAAAFSSYAAMVYTEDAFYYTIEDRSITITGYFGDDAVVNIPSMIAGLPVNHIAPYAFEGTGVTIVNLPETIETVEKSAFDASTQVNYFQREETTRPNLGDDTDPDDAGGEVETLPTGSQDDTEEETSPAESQGSTEEETSPAESQGSTEEETSPAESQSGSEEEPTSSRQETETTATGTGKDSSKGSSSAGGYVSAQVSDNGLSPDGPASSGKNAGGAGADGTNAAAADAGGNAASAGNSAISAGSAEASAAGASGEGKGSADDSGSRESKDSALSGHVEEVVEDEGFFAGNEPEEETIEERPSAVETAGTSANEAAGTEGSTGKPGSFGIFAAVIVLCLFLIFFIRRKKKKEKQDEK